MASRQLKIGESLRTRSSPRKVLSVRSLPGGHRVYNLEVQTQHCYYVGASGVLCHNARCNDLPARGTPNSSAAKDSGNGKGQIRDYGPSTLSRVC